MSNDDVELVELEGQQVTLEQLAGLDFTDTEEKRGMVSVPVGTYLFEVVVEEVDGKQLPPGWRKLGEKAAAVVPCKVLDVISVRDKNDVPDGDQTKLIGKVHREAMFLTNDDSQKYIAAFFTDIGVGHKGTAKQIFAASVGARFVGTIVSRKDPNDESRIYYSINRNAGKIQAKKAA